MIKNLILIGAGGFIGSIARYFFSKLNTTVYFFSIPLGTLAVNVIGSFVIGFVMGIASKSEILSTEWKLFLMVGICGGFTTFSSFTNESFALMQSGQFFPVIVYTALSILLGFLAVYLGYVATNLL